VYLYFNILSFKKTYYKLILSWYRSNLFERLPFVQRPQITVIDEP